MSENVSTSPEQSAEGADLDENPEIAQGSGGKKKKIDNNFKVTVLC